MSTHFKTMSATLLLLIFFMGACSMTTVTGTWKRADYTGEPFTSILVVGLVQNANHKTLWENVMADKLRQSGIQTIITSGGAFTGTEPPDENQIVEFVQKNNVQAVLVTRLVDSKKTEVYHPPSGGYYSGPYGYYDRFNLYYPHAYETVYSPGYVETVTTILLETNLYRADTRELIWSMSSNTFDPQSTTKLIDSVSAAVMKQLQKEKLI